MLVGAIGLDIAYWSIWFIDRDVLASEHRQAYYEFENAFPLADAWLCLLYTSPSPRDRTRSRMPSSA